MKTDPYCLRWHIKCTFQQCVLYIDIADHYSARGVKQRRGGENELFSAKCANISKMVGVRDSTDFGGTTH